MTGLNGQLEGMVDQLVVLLDEAMRDVDAAKATLAERQADVTRLRGMLRAAGALETQPKEAPKPKKKVPRVNEQTSLRVLAAVRSAAEGEGVLPELCGSFTMAQIVERSGLHSTTVRHALTLLREQHVIRAVGVAEANGGRAPMAFALNE